jgi:tryptophanyl-tRNA synthetase
VGKDQLPHLELSRVIARRFNERYSPDDPYFAEPQALLSQAPLLLGVDGRKMGKSNGNAIALGATADETASLVARAVTDSDRYISYEPERRPEVSSLVLMAALCRGVPPEEVAAEIGGGGGGALKAVVIEALNELLAPIRARRARLAADPGYLRQVLAAGNSHVRELAHATLDDVRRLMHMNY